MPVVLVNADDFGLHADIDRGILDCVDAGRVQSVSYCANGATVDYAKLRSLAAVGLRCGLHVTIVGEPWLTDGRTVRDWRELGRRLLTGGRTFRAAIDREIRAQLDASLQAGVEPAHVDSHQHVHAFPGVWSACERIARQRDIRIRVPVAPKFSLVKKSLGGIVLQSLAALRGRRVAKHLPCIGIARAGHNTAAIFARELQASTPSDVELVVHPGVNTPSLESIYGDWHFDWTAERGALLSAAFAESLGQAGYSLAT